MDSAAWNSKKLRHPLENFWTVVWITVHLIWYVILILHYIISYMIFSKLNYFSWLIDWNRTFSSIFPACVHFTPKTMKQVKLDIRVKFTAFCNVWPYSFAMNCSLILPVITIRLSSKYNHSFAEQSPKPDFGAKRRLFHGFEIKIVKSTENPWIVPQKKGSPEKVVV